MKKIGYLMIIALSFWQCSVMSQNYKLGTEAALNKNWDEAVEYYEKAVIEHPNNSAYRLALVRAKIAASLYHSQPSHSS